MSSTTVFDIISLKINKVLAQDLIPRFCEAAVDVASNFGDEPPSKDSMQILFEDAFKKVLETPRKKKVSESSDKVIKKGKSPRSQLKNVKKSSPAPKPQWLTRKEMEDTIEKDSNRYYCGFVADRGPNKSKFCACELTEEAKNCGEYKEDKWIPHPPSAEGETHEARCKKCWAKGKNGTYRKVGAFNKFYNKVEIEIPKLKIPDKEEIPDIPEVSEQILHEETCNKELEHISQSENDREDELSTEELLDNLVD
jgi:hypothetical protein